jgi:heme/copper-type cytochrome/quinol oxidase subunit 1
MGAIYGIFCGFYYWIGKLTGYQYLEKFGTLHFIIFTVAVNIIFFPMHGLGLAGMPRRIPDYPDIYTNLNNIMSFGSILV